MNENKELKKMLSYIKDTIKDSIIILRKKYNYQIIENNNIYIKLKLDQNNYITISKNKNYNIHINIDKIITINELNIIQKLKKLYEEEKHIQTILK